MHDRTDPAPTSGDGRAQILASCDPSSMCHRCLEDLEDCLCEFFEDDGRDCCEACGGDGYVEYNEVAHEIEPEGFPVKANHLTTCPNCGGTGNAE